MGMLLDLQLRPTDWQTYCCIWALNSFWQTFTRLHLLLENSYSALFPREPQSFWRVAIFCINCFSLYRSTLSSEAKQSSHSTKQINTISNPGTMPNLTTQHGSIGVREDAAPWKLFYSWKQWLKEEVDGTGNGVIISRIVLWCKASCERMVSVNGALCGGRNDW